MNRIKGTVLIVAGVIAGMLLSGPAAQAAAKLMAAPSSQTFYLNDQRVDLQAYEINGSNYVKLRDVGQAVDFGVTYDAATNSVHINPDQPYIEETKAVTESGTGDGYLTNGKPVTEENVLEILRQLEKEWPDGTIWGREDTPGTYKNEVPSTEAKRVLDVYSVHSIYGCGGYAAMISSLVFGDEMNPARQLHDLSQMRPGDIIVRVNNTTGKIWHVTIALESPNETNAFHITDGNRGNRVYWPDKDVTYGRNNLDSYRGELASHHLEVWTRYPESVSYTGISVGAWSTGNNN